MSRRRRRKNYIDPNVYVEPKIDNTPFGMAAGVYIFILYVSFGGIFNALVNKEFKVGLYIFIFFILISGIAILHTIINEKKIAKRKREHREQWEEQQRQKELEKQRKEQEEIEKFQESIKDTIIFNIESFKSGSIIKDSDKLDELVSVGLILKYNKEVKEANDEVSGYLYRYNSIFFYWLKGDKSDYNNAMVGAMYERFIGYIIEKEYNVSVYYNGRVEGYNDEGIDLYFYIDSNGIRTKYIVQCKCYSRKKIHTKELRAFIGAREIEKQKEENVIGFFIAHSDILTQEQKDILMDVGISYRIIEYDVKYPKIKYSPKLDRYFLPKDEEYDKLDFLKDSIMYFNNYQEMQEFINVVKNILKYL